MDPCAVGAVGGRPWPISTAQACREKNFCNDEGRSDAQRTATIIRQKGFGLTPGRDFVSLSRHFQQQLRQSPCTRAASYPEQCNVSHADRSCHQRSVGVDNGFNPSLMVCMIAPASGETGDRVYSLLGNRILSGSLAPTCCVNTCRLRALLQRSRNMSPLRSLPEARIRLVQRQIDATKRLTRRLEIFALFIHSRARTTLELIVARARGGSDSLKVKMLSLSNIAQMPKRTRVSEHLHHDEQRCCIDLPCLNNLAVLLGARK